MRLLFVPLVVCGCAGTAAPRRTPAPAPDPVPATSDIASAPPPSRPLLDRLHDPEGSVPGLPAVTLTHKASADHCGGVELVVQRGGTLGSDDAPLAALYAIEFPNDLQFDDADPRRKERSLREFNDFLDRMKAAADAAVKHYEAEFTSTLDPGALARVAQVTARFASVLVRAPIPADVRTGDHAADQRKAYCDALANAALPLIDKTDATLHRCAEIARGQPAGWWTEYCSVN